MIAISVQKADGKREVEKKDGMIASGKLIPPEVMIAVHFLEEKGYNARTQAHF